MNELKEKKYILQFPSLTLNYITPSFIFNEEKDDDIVFNNMIRILTKPEYLDKLHKIVNEARKEAIRNYVRDKI